MGSMAGMGTAGGRRGTEGSTERAAWDSQVHPGWQDWCSRPDPDNAGLCGHGKNFLGYPTGGRKLLVGLRQAAG